MKYLRWLLFPFAMGYGLVVVIRNWFYDTGVFKSRQFNLPVICIGNLEIGGAGKSPMAEYLIMLFKPSNKPATLSRGYGRETKGFVLATAITTATEIGDEPAQFKHKYPDVTVAVCEDRAAGISKLEADHDFIILDDAFQHRAVKPGFSILLFDYNYLQQPHLLLPAGNLREPFSSRRRADVMVVTKCPANLNATQIARCNERLKPQSHQQLFFSAISYLGLQSLSGMPVNEGIDAATYVFLLTGIANPKPLAHHIGSLTKHIIHHNYPDHHRFSLKNITKLADDFAACKEQKKLIITTEKDAQRLGVQPLQAAVAQLPILVMPIGIEFLNNGQQQFNQLLITYVREHTKHNQLY